MRASVSGTTVTVVWALVAIGCAGGPPSAGCDDDETCPVGQHCAPGGCRAECTGASGECELDETCDVARGRCISTFDAGARDAGAHDAAASICDDHGDCADDLFCNGAETCQPSAAAADARGCVSGGAPCAAGASCDEGADECRTSCDEDLDGNGRLDADNDGDMHRSLACDGDDCDDDDPDRYPRGGAEVCDPLAPDHDEDCNPCTIASFIASDGDRDGDGYYDVGCSNPLPSGVDPATFTCPISLREFVAVDTTRAVVTGTDCADDPATGAAIHPTEAEACNGIDDDCDAEADEGVDEIVYIDCDGDGWGESGAGETGCHGSALPSAMGCGAGGQYVRGRMLSSSGSLAFDCNGSDASINPMASDGCPMDDGVDNDCDGRTDEAGSETVFPDCDRDAWPRGSGSIMGCHGNPLPESLRATLGCAVGATWARAASQVDCNDGNPSIYPSAPESCNGANDDCDASTDEGTVASLYFDSDGDGYGSGALATVCIGTPRYVSSGADCDDSRSNVYPGASEICDGRDNNCDGRPDTDLGVGLMSYRYRDFDGDGYGGGSAQLVCNSEVGYSTVGGDCRDSDSRVFQVATVRLDEDGDGYCNASGTYTACVGQRSGGLYTHAWALAGGVDTYFSSVRDPGSCLGDECYGANWFGSDRNAHAPAARGCRYEVHGAANGCGCGIGCCTCSTARTMTCDPGYEPSTTGGYDRCFRVIENGGGNCSPGTRSVSGRSATCTITQTCNGLEGTTCHPYVFCSPCASTGC